MKELDLDKETYPYLNLWLLQGNELEMFWDDEAKSLIRAYVDEELFWRSDENIQSLDQGLKALNEFLGDTVYSEAEDFTEGWKHSD